MDLPEQIKNLVGRCEANEVAFKNDDMSAALMFGETLWNRLTRLKEYYEKISGNFMPGDVRSNCFADAAKDLREVQDSVIREMKKNG